MPYTKQSEVYSISMIMWELTSKKPPFSDYKHDIGLALSILIDELRPEIVEGTPDFYVDIMRQCWNPDPLQVRRHCRNTGSSPSSPGTRIPILLR